MNKKILLLVCIFFASLSLGMKAFAYDFNDTGIIFIYGDEQYPIVINVMNGSPAQIAGIKQGDIITDINNVDTFGQNIEDTLQKFNNENSKTLTMKLKTETLGKIEDKSITFEPKPDSFNDAVLIPANIKISVSTQFPFRRLEKGNLVKLSINPKAYKIKNINWSNFNLTDEPYFIGEVTGIGVAEDRQIGVKMNIKSLVLKDEAYDVTGIMHTGINDYAFENTYTYNYNIILTEDLCLSDKTLKEEVLNAKYKLSDKIKEEKHQEFIANSNDAIKFLGGFSFNSSMLDILKYYNDIPTVKSISFKISFTNFVSSLSTTILNYKNNINAKTLGEFFDLTLSKGSYSSIKKVTFKDGATRNLYDATFVVDIESIMINQIPFNAKLVFKTSPGYYFANRDKALLSPKGNACLFYLDSMSLTVQETDQALNIASRNNESLLNSYRDKYKDFEIANCKEGFKTYKTAENTGYVIDSCYATNNMQILIGKQFAQSKILNITYSTINPIDKENKLYEDFTYKLENNNNKQYSLDSKI